MAKLTNTPVNRNSAVQSSRTFDEACAEVYTVEEFCKKMGITQVDIRINPKVINNKTGQNNLFLAFGKDIGAVSEKIQRAFWKDGETPDRPMVGLMNLEDGSQIYQLFNQGGAESAFSLGLED